MMDMLTLIKKYISVNTPFCETGPSCTCFLCAGYDQIRLKSERCQSIIRLYETPHSQICCIYCTKFDTCKARCRSIDIYNQKIICKG